MEQPDTVVEAVFLDFSKAFDTISHRILLDKLKAIGVSGRLLRVLTSYLSNRKQYVDIDGHKSSLLDIFSGIPQGSILGPLLFLVYVIDLTVNVRSSTYAFC